MQDEIIIDYHNEGSFFGKNGVRYVYTPALRKRIDECLYSAKRSTNRFFVLENDIVRAAQSTREGALHYMKASANHAIPASGCASTARMKLNIRIGSSESN